MKDELTSVLNDVIARRLPEMVKLRRHLHAHPEPSGCERDTSLLLYQRLAEEDFDVRLGVEGRGVIADFPPVSPKNERRSDSAEKASSPSLGGGGGERRLALRADIDALHIHDAKRTEYRSRCDGVMHACGHDAHTAIVFGALTALADLTRAGASDDVPLLRGVFQPGEETCTGAREMISVGALEGVGAILATHVDPSRQVGRVGLRAGVLTANCDEMTITIRGRGGHAARPHETSDPIVAAAQLINGLYLFVPRRTDSQDAVVVTIGQMTGGDTANVIPEEVMLRGTVRTLERRVRERTFDHIRHLARGTAETTDTKIAVEFGVGADSVVNDATLVNVLREAALGTLGDEGIEEIPRPSMGSEDFAFYLQHVPGAMMRVGCTSSRAGGAPLHSQEFDIDEDALRVGATILARAALNWGRRRER